MALEPGTKVGRYTIARLIAQGGMAEVYRAEQDLTGGISRPVAVKVIRPEYSESSDFRQMFLDEARTACTLSHPNIVHIYEVGESEDGLLYMAMELVSGETLATVNRTLRGNDERFSDEALFSIGILTCSALDAVHALKTEGGTVNLVHRDVSPHNLLLSTTGSLKLIDFGIAKAATNRNLTMPGVTKGKAGYFSPEQAMGKKLDGRSDLFSLGVTLYKLASGGTPFDDFTNHAERHAALVRGQWKHLEDVYPGLPDGFYEVVRRSLGLKPDERYQTARDMREALEKAAFDAGIRVGQSSLMGYLDDDGEVTAAGGSRMSAFPAITAPPSTKTRALSGATRATPPESEGEPTDPTAAPLPPPTAPPPPLKHATEKLPPPPPVERSSGLGRKLLLAGAFVAAVAVGVAGAVLAVGDVEERAAPQPPPKPVVVVEARPKPEPLVDPVPVPPPDEPVVDAGPAEVAVVAPAPPPPRPGRPTKPRPVAVAKPPPDKPAPKPEPKPEPAPKEEPIPAGKGKLRISVNAAATITVGAEDWGEPPVNREVSSGVHRVSVKLSDGTTSSTRASVFPDKTTIVKFDAASQRWSTSSN